MIESRSVLGARPLRVILKTCRPSWPGSLSGVGWNDGQKSRDTMVAWSGTVCATSKTISREKRALTAGRRAHRHAIVHSYVQLLRILQILEHDFAALQGLSTKASLEDFEVLGLWCGCRRVSMERKARLANTAPRAYLLLERIIADCEQALGEEHLQLFDEDVLRVVDADKELDDICSFRSPVIWTCEPSAWTSTSSVRTAQRERHTRRRIDRIRSPFRVVVVLGFVPGIADKLGVAVPQLDKEGVSVFDEGGHNATDRVASSSARDGTRQ